MRRVPLNVWILPGPLEWDEDLEVTWCVAKFETVYYITSLLSKTGQITP
jgi:hypothetical protein